MTQTQVASVFGVSSSSIVKWGRKGCPRQPGGTYDLAAVCHWVLKGACDLTRLPQIEMLKLLAVTKPTLGDWETKGMPRNADGSYDATKAVPWRIARLEEKTSEARQLSELEREKIQATKLSNRLAEIELAEKRGEMLSRPATVAGWVARVQVVKSSLQSMIGRIAGLGLSDEQLAAVKAEVIESVRRFAARGVLLQLDPEIAAKVEALIAAEIVPPAPETVPVSTTAPMTAATTIVETPQAAATAIPQPQEAANA